MAIATPTVNADLDLTDVATVAAYMNSACSSAAFARTAQLLITAASEEWLRLTGHAIDGIIPAKSPFLGAVSYTEWYDGSGGDSLYTRTWPIQSVTLLQGNGSSIPLSASWNQYGYVIDTGKKCLMLRAGSSALVPPSSQLVASYGSVCVFPRGTQNIYLQSSRGFASLPSDVTRAVTQIVIANYNRASAEGLDSFSMSVSGRSGSMGFSRLMVPPQVQACANFYACKYF